MTLYTLAVLASTADGVQNIWDWFLQNVSLQGTLNIAGLSLIVVLFARDLILTKGQHERRVADIVANYERLLDVQKERYAEMRESRDYWRTAHGQEKDRADKATSQVVETTEIARAATQVLVALEEAAEGASHGP